MDRRSFLVKGSLGFAGVATGAGGGSVMQGRHDGRAKEEAERDGRGSGSTNVVYSVDTTAHLAALTFDDGPHPRLTEPLLDMLQARHVLATFFLVARTAVEHPEIVARQVRAGHELGNHTWSHPRMSDLTAAGAKEEVARGAESLAGQTGTRPRWFRSPRGVLTGPVMHAATAAHHDVAMWSGDLNWRLPLSPPAEVTKRLVGQLHPGVIFDLHDGTGGRDHDPKWEPIRERQLARLPDFIDAARATGYEFVTLSDLADQAVAASTPPAPSPGSPGSPDVSPTKLGG